MMALHPVGCTFRLPFSSSSSSSSFSPGSRRLRCAGDNQAPASLDTNKLVLEVKEKLQREHANLPIGKNGRDDEEMLHWFLKDRRFSFEKAAMKLSKAIKWREDFGVSNLCQESVQELYATGKAYVHDFPDNKGRPVFVVVARKHFPGKQEFIEDEKLCVYLIENALSKLPPGVEEILGIVDLRGFRIENTDIQFLKFLIDVFYYYYPKRLGQVLFVNAPLVFRPVWQLIKPLLKSYASLARFCDMDTVRKEYFTESTVPPDFLD
ncbi:CRAL-TRIO domain-containing protein C3H8.02 [Curcuma longa]|uniref:CRAL-TRIO domain-containing protein C3H8.02 n=1 Tax=Curcuma longa TaxID=136217 RepID=UPI003D9DF302